ncbi:methyltransferase FGSG_00040 [Lotus japonicus]|uniref:methyltransferase FGSG_00040 n=1 Tax=Lotus japonicus TaxID=34305 RepID=UPI002588E34F|nr:methyltransferase FGSG_00040 [Lotus japonicus]
MTEEEEYLQLQHLRSKATELFIREEWKDSIDAYTHFINLCTHQIQISHSHPEKLRKSLCIALCNRAEASSRLRDFHCALQDCDHALNLDPTHFKTLVCKGKILLGLNRYSMALECFRIALLDPQAAGNSETLNGYFQKCKKFEFLSRTGSIDLSDWVANGFPGKAPELAEHIGAVEIKKSEISGRGLFATKNIDAGSLILVTKAIAIERSLLNEGKDLSEDAQLVIWKNFVDKVSEFIRKCHKTRSLIGRLSIGENEDGLEVPDVDLFRPQNVEDVESIEEIDMVKLLAILDVNSLTEDAVSANILRKQNDCYGVGLWLLPAFINHSCCPNARRLHVGDYLIVHASKDLKAGEEITFAYLDPLSPLNKRKEMSVTWGIHCKCRRCKFEGEIFSKQEMKEIEIGVERGLLDVGGVVYKLEDQMKRWKVRGKEKGFLRASFWSAYSEAYRSERSMKRWGRRIPALDAVVDSVTDVVGGDHRLLRILVEEMKKNGGGHVEMEKVFKLAKDVYGKVVKKQAMRKILELCIAD